MSGSMDNTIRLWDERNNCVNIIHQKFGISQLLELNDKRVVSSCDDTYLRVWDITSGDLSCVEVAHAHPIQSMAQGPKRRVAVLNKQQFLTVFQQVL